MRKIIFGTSLFIVLVATGCGNSRLHQSLLLHENRQLEHALFVAHAQITDLQRENNSLRRQQTNEFSEPPRRPRVDSWNDDWGFPPVELPPMEMQRILVPDESGTTEVPALLRGSQMIPTWSPDRR